MKRVNKETIHQAVTEYQAGATAETIAKKFKVSKQSVYVWSQKASKTSVKAPKALVKAQATKTSTIWKKPATSTAKTLKALTQENALLKLLVADLALKNKKAFVDSFAA